MKFRFLVVLLLFLSGFIRSQERKVVLSGYLKDLFFYYHPETPIPGIDAKNLNSSIIHNRLNFRWYAADKLTFSLEARNRMFFGQMIRELPLYKSTIDFDPGYFDLSAVVAEGNAWFLHTNIDRASMEYTSGKWQVSLGRQRINWGINLVWNPNDLFNTFSYFDFDYEERPGSDAIRMKYFTGATSSAELAFKAGYTSNENTLAGLYRFTQWNYDFQFLAGQSGPDYVVGTGWSGDILGGGFRGEVSWFIPRVEKPAGEESLVASVSGDYTLKNSLYLHGGFLFNSLGASGKTMPMSIFDQNLSAKMISPAMYSLFLQTSYPVTPLISLSAASIINPGDGSFFIGPSATCSLGNNLELMFTGQLFFGEEGTEYGDVGKAIFARLKWSY